MEFLNVHMIALQGIFYFSWSLHISKEREACRHILHLKSSDRNFTVFCDVLSWLKKMSSYFPFSYKDMNSVLKWPLTLILMIRGPNWQNII